MLGEVEAGFGTVGGLIEEARFKAAIREAMRLAGVVNPTRATRRPWALIKTDRERAATVLYVSLRAVDNLKVIFTPFLPFSSQVVHELLGYEGYIAGPLEVHEVVEEGGEQHHVLTGDYASWVGSWEPTALPAGQPLREPRPLFRKLDLETVLRDELGEDESPA